MKHGPQCPKCRQHKHVVPSGDRCYWCNDCKMLFDDDPNEGSSVFNDPTKRIELEDERRKSRGLTRRRR